MKILFVSPEVVPFAKTGGLADVSGSLPIALAESGHKCTVVLPFYQLVTKNGFSPKVVKKNMKVKMGPGGYVFDLRFLRHQNIDVYFIDNKKFYDRKELYGTPQGDYPDNALRFAFFAKSVLATLDYIGGADIIHCNDWQSALIPLYLKLAGKDRNSGTLLTIHNTAYQGTFGAEVMPLVDLPAELFTPEKLEFYGKVSFMKAGIIYADAVSTVSKGYAKEILTEQFGCGLDGLLRTRRDSLYGILNGASYEEWNPKTDKYIKENYDDKNLSGKEKCKKDLLESFGLPFHKERPVIGMVTRLAEQKGIDLVAETLEKIVASSAYFVILGTGDEKYNNLFKAIAKKNKNKVGVKIAFDNSLAHKIEAGSDMFLMPSRYEPCGLNQMYSLKYGTVPIVRATGGLDDTIADFEETRGIGNGFKFTEASAGALYTAVKRAVDLYKGSRKKWLTLQQNGLRCDFSWNRSAGEYAELYKKILGLKK